jgi:hypothetical protein
LASSSTLSRTRPLSSVLGAWSPRTLEAPPRELIDRDDAFARLATYVKAVSDDAKEVKTDKGFDIFSTVGIPGTGKTVRAMCAAWPALLTFVLMSSPYYTRMTMRCACADVLAGGVPGAGSP